jgi:hypothetical protein
LCANGLRTPGLYELKVVITDTKGLAGLLPYPKVPVLPFLAGFTLAADLKITRDYLGGQRISADAMGETLVVGPA